VDRERDLRSSALRAGGRGLESGAVAAMLGVVSVLRGLRAFRDGKRGRGLVRFAVGAVLLAVAAAQRRAREAIESPEAAAVTSHGEATASEAATVTSDADAEAPDVDVVDDEPRALEDQTAGEDMVDVGALPDDVDRLGVAAFDAQSREVPVPQRAFNQGFLAHSAEAFWGVRERDDAVLVSQDYDAVQGREGVRFVDSSEIGTDVRELPIPDAILDHWDVVYRGGTAVVGGDDVLFATTDDLAADHVLRVLPAAWADDSTE
jgi:hypothetical protein